jgi:replicative DNA helicase
LKALSEVVAAPVVVGAQVSREAARLAEVPGGKSYGDPAVQNAIRKRRPQLHHLREGGSEQEADLVLGLLNYRADYLEDEGERDEGKQAPPVTRLEVGSLKNRYGAVGHWATLAFEARYGLLRDPLREDEV